MAYSCSLFCGADEFEALCRDLHGRADRLSLQVKGGSMFPAIRSGDWVELQLLPRALPPVPGEILLFRKDNSLYLHRVIKSSRTSFLAKGDASIGPDGVVSTDAVLGRAVAVRRGTCRIDLDVPCQRALALVVARLSLFLQWACFAAAASRPVLTRLLFLLQSLPWYRRAAAVCCSSAVSVRRAGPGDEEQLRDLYCMAGFDVRRGLRELAGRGWWLVAGERGRIVAAVTLACDENGTGAWMISGLEVKPLCRGRGIGRKLMEAALACAAENGCQRIGLFVNKQSRPARALYRSLGFRDGGEPPGGYNRAGDEEYLSKALIPGSDALSRLAREMIGAGDGCGLALRLAQEGVLYPLYPVILAASGFEQRPALQQAYYAQVAGSEEFRSRTQPVLDALEAAAVPVAVFKGPAVDALVYADGYLRPRLDLDVLVREDDLPALVGVLSSLGYSAEALDPRYPLPEYRNSRVFTHSSAAYTPVHVHRSLFNNSFLAADGYLGVPDEAVWQQIVAWRHYGSIRALQPEADVIFLCEHGLKHDFEQRVYLYEIAGVIARCAHSIDWQKLVLLARQWKLERPVYCGLSLVRQVLGAPVPGEVVDGLAPGGLTAAEKRFMAGVIKGVRRHYGCLSVYRAMRRGWTRKIRFILCVLAPPGFSARSFCLRLLRWGRSCFAG